VFVPAPDGGDGGPFTCAALNPAPRFCSDFDQPLPAPWDLVSEVRGGTARIEESAFVSSVPTGSGAAIAACLTRSFSGPYKSIRIDFDIRVDELGDAPYDFVNIDKNTQHEIGLQILRTGAVQLDEDVPEPDGGPGESQILTLTDARFEGVPPAAQWKHVRLDFVINAEKATLDVDVGGVKKTGYTLKTPVAVSTGFTLQLGDCGIDPHPTKPWKVRFDSFVLDVTQ